MADLLTRIGGRGRDGIQLYDDYSTSFSGSDENPIAEDGLWDNGFAISGFWRNFRVVGNKAYGTQTGAKPPYDDSVAVRRPRTGRTWHPDQDVRGRVALTNRSGWDGGGFHELEIHLRSSISNGNMTTYELVFSMNAGTTYCEITQWLGPTASTIEEGPNMFINLKRNASFTSPANGDWIRGTIIGNIIRAYTSTNGTNWTECITAHDITTVAADNVTIPTPILSGYPGMGHWKNDSADIASSYAFDRFSAQRAYA